MRPGVAVAAACLALLSCLRFAEQSYPAAAVFAVLALGALGLGLRRGRASVAPDRIPSATELTTAQEAHERYRRGWRRIAIGGLAISLVGAVVFPPLALVVAGLTLYSVHRMRQSSRATQMLGRVAS